MSAATSLTVRVPLAIKTRSGRKVIVSPDGTSMPLIGPQVRTAADPALMKALARAFRWKRMLDDGRYASISKIAKAEKIDRGYVGSVLRLTLLAPDVVEALVDEQRFVDASLPALMEPLPLEWDRQRAVILERSMSDWPHNLRSGSAQKPSPVNPIWAHQIPDS